jgi:hypothetical protein
VVPVSLITLEQCRQVKPRFLSCCGSGPLVRAEVPVKNKACSLYRDDSIKVTLRYGERGRWEGLDTDMAPRSSRCRSRLRARRSTGGDEIARARKTLGSRRTPPPCVPAR